MFKGKKGFLDEIVELILPLVALLAIGIILVILISSVNTEREDKLKTEISYIDARYQTNTLLNIEVKENYFLSDLIIDSFNRKDYKELVFVLDDIMKNKIDPENEQPWYFVIDGQVIYEHNVDKIPTGSLAYLPRVQLPNPYGRNMNVLFRKIDPADDLFEKKVANFVEGNPAVPPV